MTSFAELKARSRAKLHEAMSFPATFYANDDADPVVIRVRKHITNPMLQGDMKGTNLSYAETQEAPTKLVFRMADVLDIQRGSLVVFSPTEGYLIDHTLVPYGETVVAEVKVAAPEDLAGKLSPGEV